MKASAESAAKAASKRCASTACTPYCAEQPELGRRQGEPERPGVGHEEAARMRLEGERHQRRAERLAPARPASASSAWWPRCTPSKLPSATTPPFQAAGAACQSSKAGIMSCRLTPRRAAAPGPSASPSITTLSPLRHWVLSVTRRRFSSMAVMVATAVIVSPISTGAMKFMVWEI